MPAVEEQVQEVQNDSAAYIKARNEGKPIAEAREIATTRPEIEEKPKPQAEEHPQRLPRSIRREMNRLREEIGSYKAKLEMFEKNPPAKEAPKEETEPKRSDFPAGDEGTAQFLRAATKWDKAQEAKAAGQTDEQKAQNEQMATLFKEMDEKAVADAKSLKDWDEVAAKASEDEDAPEFVIADHPTLAALLARSDMRAYLLYFWAHPENYENLEHMLELSKDPSAQIAAFHRLEGRLEKLYDADRSGDEPDKKAAQATEPRGEPKDRRHLAEAARPGEPQEKVHSPKPKPSTSVSAKGGEPPLDESQLTPAQRIARRNQAQFGR